MRKCYLTLSSSNNDPEELEQQPCTLELDKDALIDRIHSNSLGSEWAVFQTVAHQSLMRISLMKTLTMKPKMKIQSAMITNQVSKDSFNKYF